MFLGLREMDKDHTAENILTATEELLGKFDLSLDIDFNTEYVDDDDDDEDYDEGNLSNIPDESILLEAFPQRISCFAHSLQLVILKFFKDDVIYFSGYKKMMDVSRRSLHERCEATVKLPLTTRWGSLIEVIRQFLEVKQSLGEIQSLKTLTPTAEDTCNGLVF
uniref:Transposase n=1 Tax=Ditylenchus dipsaci TaxID=166011 RepID=A0A915CM17_9BILA